MQIQVDSYVCIRTEKVLKCQVGKVAKVGSIVVPSWAPNPFLAVPSLLPVVVSDAC